MKYDRCTSIKNIETMDHANKYRSMIAAGLQLGAVQGVSL